MERTAFFINPAAGSGRAAQIWQALKDRYGAEVTAAADHGWVVEAADPRAARSCLDRLLRDASSVERLVVVGGDGSVHLAVNGVLDADAGQRVALSLVPAGTGSDLARTLGVPRRPKAALEALGKSSRRQLDALELSTAEGRRVVAINVLSLGISGLVDLRVNAQRRRGTLAFLTASVVSVLQYRAQPCRIEVDGQLLYDGPLYLLAVGNGRYFGKGMKGLPKAVVDDGRADVLIVPPKPRVELLGLRLPQLYLGKHLGAKGLIYTQAHTIRVVPSKGFPPFDLDGETYAASEGVVKVLGGAVTWAG
ncbi:MAG: diacylglycerol kinase family protein [Acidobacteriota bacterium]|nr:diacylglycerol kinase family protein [Acidobacteriota bacterium]